MNWRRVIRGEVMSMEYIDRASGRSYITGGLYFLSKDFFARFSSSCPYISLSDKRGEDGAGRHGRPHICIGASHKALLWMAPISSRVEKYEREIAWQRQKYGACDKVQIVRLSTGKRAALIQNIIPCTPRYIDGEYTNRQTGLAEKIGQADLRRVCISARKLIVMHRCAPKCGFLFTDVFGIARALLDDIREREAMNNSFEYDLRG